MTKKVTEQQLLDELQTRYGREVSQAFQKAVEDLRTMADAQRVLAAVQAGDIEGAIRALHLDPAAYGPLLDAIRDAYTAGGRGVVSLFPPLRQPGSATTVVRFDVRNVRAEQWLREQSSTFITRILDDQREAARQALSAGMRRGDNPTTTALDIVGRIDKATGKRQGGILGLTAQQQSFLDTARDELTGADPAGMRNYLTRNARDRRFDPSVKKALREGTPLDPAIADKALRQYSNRLLKLRGDLIGKHETFAALASARHEAYRQAVESGAVSAAVVTKTWRHFPNEHPRVQHQAMNGKSVGFDEQFQMPDGSRMLYPHDPRAPVSQTAGCHCQADYEIDFLAGLS